MSYKVLFLGVLAIGLSSFVGCQSESHSNENFGHFKGKVTAKWLPDGRTMKLTRRFAYIAPGGKRWNAPRGSVVDGASIPKACWSIIGGPFEGKFRNASVVHDVACNEMTQPWQEVHEMFYNACRCGGVGELKAKTMYAAVYHRGPRWGYLVEAAPGGGQRRKAVKQAVSIPTEETLRKCQQYIEANNPSLENIRKRDFLGDTSPSP